MPDSSIEELNRISEGIIGAAIAVHRALGPGYTESMYEMALCLELETSGIHFQRQAPISVEYRGIRIGDMRLDIIVAEQVVVELKAIDRLTDIHTAQVLSYLKATRLRLGLLINFNVPVLTRGVKRIINTQQSLSL